MLMILQILSFDLQLSEGSLPGGKRGLALIPLVAQRPLSKHPFCPKRAKRFGHVSDCNELIGLSLVSKMFLGSTGL